MDNIKLMGRFEVEQWRKDKLINKIINRNGIVNGGLDKLLEIMFHFSASINTWYVGLIDNSGFSALAATDTMSSHPGWTEYTDYSETTRQAWDEGAPSGQIITSDTTTNFNMNDTGTVNGIFITSSNTKNGTSGTLWASGSFSSAIAVTSGDILNITYSITAAAA